MSGCSEGVGGLLIYVRTKGKDCRDVKEGRLDVMLGKEGYIYATKGRIDVTR